MLTRLSPFLSVQYLSRLGHKLTYENFRRALADLAWGLRGMGHWSKEGLQQFRQRRIDSRLGRLWPLLPLLITLGVLGPLYGLILDQRMEVYLPYLLSGTILWLLVAGIVLDGEGAFLTSQGQEQLLRTPYSIPVFRLIWCNLIRFAHNAALLLLVMLWYGNNPGMVLLGSLPALLFLLGNGVWIGLLAAILGARFADFPKIFNKVFYLSFLITPILWHRQMLAGWEFIADLNPLYYLIELVRAPLLGLAPSPGLLAGGAMVTLAGGSLTLMLLTAFYWRLPYWAWSSSHRSSGHGVEMPPWAATDQSEPEPEDYVPETPTPEAPRSPPVRLIAFYLPQFHPIPENDRWWGKGFTEWTNVSRATPQFVGHDQPRLPGALGFYDLRLPEVQAEQMRLARHYGLYGFCYYYYWFGGQRLLERPLQQILADPGLDLPFCLCWANENWTRRWDGEDQEILMGQRHSAADDLALIAALEPVFRDPRYIQVDGKPLFIVYRPQILPDAAATVARWRQYAADQGLPGLFLVAAQSFSDALGADDTLFDALVEFPPHTVPRVPLEARPRLLNPHFRGELLDYRAGVTAAEAAVDAPPAKLTFPGVMTAWDNSARRREAATIFAQATPQAYGRWLSAACRRALRAPRPDQRLVFINAWNEWAEGAYLEPDQRHGFAYLHTTREVLLAAAHGFPGHDQPRLLVVGHDAHRHGAQLLTLHLLRLFARRFGYRPRLWLLGDGALRPAYEALAEVQMVTPETTAALAQHLRQEGLDRALVNTVVSAAVLPALAAAGVRSLALIHEMPQLIQERGLEANAQAVVTHANAIVFAADTVRQAFASLVPLPAERALLLPQGLYQDLSAPPTARAQVRQALGLPTDAILVLNVGYGDARKGLDLFLDAARLTHSADARFHFLWLGDIDARFQARLARERPRAGYLHQIPFTAEVAPYYAAADLFLLSSREDPFPSVVLEALGCGLPVVAFADSGGHGELLGDPLHGALSPPGDVSALSQALRDLAQAEAQAPQRRAQRAAAARARFDFVHYGWRLLRQLDPRLQAVSVIVPNYNYAAYLRPRLHSIFDQRYPLFELLVLDDASTDASREVIAACSQEAQRELRLLTNADNSGSVFAQWRQGVAQAQGELVWLAEADDVAAPPFLATLAPAFATQPDLVFAFCDSAQIDGAGQPLGDSYAAYCGDYGDLDFHQDFTVSAGRFLRQGLGVRNTVLNVSAVLFRRQALLAAMERLGPALEQWRIAGDWRLYIELCRGGGEVAYVASALNQHRRHQASVVGAHGLDRHIAEITAMHQELAPEAREDDRLARHQRDYIESLYRQAREQDQG